MYAIVQTLNLYYSVKLVTELDAFEMRRKELYGSPSKLPNAIRKPLYANALISPYQHHPLPTRFIHPPYY